MKNIIYPVLFLSVLLFVKCEKPDPQIATNDELPMRAFGEHFICQPITVQGNMIALIDRNNAVSIASFDENGEKSWNQNVEEYVFSGLNYQNIPNISLQKDGLNNILLNMQVTQYNQFQEIVNQYIKSVKFNESGQYLSQFADTIHQPDTIIMQQDTISLIPNKPFKSIDGVSFSNGTSALISYQLSEDVDSTFLQLSIYSSSGNFVRDRYIKIPRHWDIEQIYATSDGNLFAYAGLKNSGKGFFMINLQGNVIFRLLPPEFMVDMYFFYENSQGEYIISASVVDNGGNFKGTVFNINSQGTVLWQNTYNQNPSWFMQSVQETTDGYIFSGFNSSAILLTGVDWRNTFTGEEHHAVIYKTDLNGQEQFSSIIQAPYYTAGALTIGGEQISYFSGKYERTVKSIILYKLDEEGGLVKK